MQTIGRDQYNFINTVTSSLGIYIFSVQFTIFRLIANSNQTKRPRGSMAGFPPLFRPITTKKHWGHVLKRLTPGLLMGRLSQSGRPRQTHLFGSMANVRTTIWMLRLNIFWANCTAGCGKTVLR
jgi:hypothetical protein